MSHLPNIHFFQQQQGTENGSSNADMAISDFEDANSEEEEKKPHHKFKAVLESRRLYPSLQ